MMKSGNFRTWNTALLVFMMLAGTAAGLPGHRPVAEAAVTGYPGIYYFNEGTGSTTADSSGNGNTATLVSSPAWTKDAKRGHGIHFDGSGEHVEIPNSASLENVQEGDYSISAWFKPDSIPVGATNRYAIVMKKGASIGLSFSSNSKFVMSHYINDGSGDVQKLASSAIAGDKDRWYHVAGTVDKANGEIKIYVNGKLEGMTTFDDHTPAREYGTEKWRMGIADTNPMASLQWKAEGTIDSVMIMTGVMTASEVQSRYDADRLFTFKGDWRFDESSGSTTTDNSGNLNTGNLINSPTRTAGIFKNAVSLNGSNQYVEIPNSGTMQNIQENNYSLSAMFKPNSIPSQNPNIAYGIVMKQGFHMGIYLNQNGKFVMTHYLTGDVPVSAVSTTTANTGEWYHVVGTVSVGLGVVSLYVNGELEAQTTFTPGTATREYGVQTFKIGAATLDSQYTHKWAADGTIDQVVISVGAMTNDYVKQLYGNNIQKHTMIYDNLYTTTGAEHGFSYTGDWTKDSNPGNYIWTAHESDTTNDYVQLEQEFDRVRIYGRKTSDAGKVDIDLDGNVTTVDLYSATDVFQTLIYDSGPIAYTEHDLKIKVKGTKHASSTGYKVYFDFLEIETPGDKFHVSVKKDYVTPAMAEYMGIGLFDSQLAALNRGTANDDYIYMNEGSFTEPAHSHVVRAPAARGAVAHTSYEDVEILGVPDSGYHNGWRAWLVSIYKIDSDESVGFLHMEDQDQDGGVGREVYKTALAYSDDGGLTYSYLGNIITTNMADNDVKARSETDPGINMGGVPIIVDNGYLYAIYRDYRYVNNEVEGGVAIARTSVAGLVNAVRNSQVPTFNKYKDGVWTENGIGGDFSTIGQFDTHTIIAYSSTLGKYITRSNAPRNTGFFQYGLLMTDDFLNWNVPAYALYQEPSSSYVAYPSFYGRSLNPTEFGTEVFMYNKEFKDNTRIIFRTIDFVAP